MNSIPIHRYQGRLLDELERAGFTILDEDNPYYDFEAVLRLGGIGYRLGLNIVEGASRETWEMSPLNDATVPFLEQALDDETMLRIPLKKAGHDS